MAECRVVAIVVPKNALRFQRLERKSCGPEVGFEDIDIDLLQARF